MTSDLEKVKAWSDYRRLVLPLLIEQIFMMLIGNFNVFLLSLYNDQAVAATGIADQILVIGTMAMGMVSLGSTVLILQNSDDHHVSYIQRVIRQAFLLNLILAVLLEAIVLVFGDQLMTWMQTPAELFDMAVLYLKIVGFSLLFQGLQTTVSAVLRGYGHVKTAMNLSIINSILTIAGNALVVLVPGGLFGGGVIGIGIMTVLTRFTGAILSIWALSRRLPQVWSGLWTFQASDAAVGRKILSLGIPSGMENVFYNVSQTIITGVVASLGTAAVTGRIYTTTITAVIFTCSVAVGQATQIIIGRFLRKKQAESARRFVLKNLALSVGAAVALAVVIALLGPWLIGIFTDDPEISAIVQNLLWFQCIYEPLRVTDEIVIASLNVTGDVKFPVIAALLVTYLFTVPAALILVNVFNQGIVAIWIVFIIDEGSRALMFVIRWARGSWENYDLIHREEDDNELA